MVGGLDPVVVEDVDMFHLQAIKAGLDAVDETLLRIDGILHASPDPLFGGNHDLVTYALFFLETTHHLFVAAVLVDRSGIEVSNAEFVGAAKDSGHVGVHYAHADDRLLEAGASQGAFQQWACS